MKRLHVHVSVDDLDKALAFYGTLFGCTPSVRKPDYAKWMLDDPRVNFAISCRGARAGIDHLGIQADDDAEMRDVHDRLVEAGASLVEEGETTCCYARSEKSWAIDPAGTRWEVFHTIGDSAVYGQDSPHLDGGGTSACCTGSQDGPAPSACR